MAKPELEQLLEQARQAQAEEAWRRLLALVREIQAIDPEAAQPFIDALWAHIAQNRHARQNRMDIALTLRRMAQDGAWVAVYREIQTLAREDEAAAMHVARLLFVDASYFHAHPARVSERVHTPSPIDTLTRPVRIRLYRYGYGPQALDRPWTRHWYLWVGLVPLLFFLPALTAPLGWVRLGIFAVGWLLLALLPQVPRERVRVPGLRAVAAGLLVLGALPPVWPAHLFTLAGVVAGLLLGFWAAWSRRWLPVGAWSQVAWGSLIGLAAAGLRLAPLPWNLVAAPATLLAGLLGHAAVRFLEPRWDRDAASRPALALLFLGYLALLLMSGAQVLTRLPPPQG